jgi:hypothetical protein
MNHIDRLNEIARLENARDAAQGYADAVEAKMNPESASAQHFLDDLTHVVCELDIRIGDLRAHR